MFPHEEPSEADRIDGSMSSQQALIDILQPGVTGYGLTVFTEAEIASIKIFKKSGKPYLTCFASDKERPAKPEEIVRQLYLKRLMTKYRYPKSRIAVEKPVQFGGSVADKRADIVVFREDDPGAAYIIVEVKKPKRRDGIEQLKSYCNAEAAPVGVWLNGESFAYLHREDPNVYKNLGEIPRSDQSLSELLAERWDLKRLNQENRLVRERLSLKSIILDMEDLVLANAGVDAFEEVFKLIYSKLYDEWSAARPGKRYLEFRVGGLSPREAYDRINALFDKAKQQWPGVFLRDEKIELTPPHLAVCATFLQDIKLFNANLQIIDEAFEYLAVQVGKGSKGQYFTPRHVIDMAVKMLNPKLDETMIDTAAGSCGFSVHTIFHVWGSEFTAAGPEKWQSEYAAQMVYGIDFDARSVKIAKALNLIAGDGKTNVYKANTLDPRSWPDDVKVGLRDRLRRFPDDPAMDDWNQKNYRHFDFDVLMTNPPFAGDIKDSRILHQFELAKKGKKKWAAKAGRDLLFIERNLEFLKPGGRMCIVLPQGRFNNISDEYVRRFIAQHARILAVVGLDVNTFKPHTGTKTSVLFLQKWNENPEEGPLCKRIKDYPLFFAVSQRGGKDSSGDYVYRVGEDGTPALDSHHHLIVDHDLDQIAEAFISFGEEQGFTFLQEED